MQHRMHSPQLRAATNEKQQMSTFAVAVNGGLPVSPADTTINAFHWILAQAQAVLQHIHHDLELTEDQHLETKRVTEQTQCKLDGLG